MRHDRDDYTQPVSDDTGNPGDTGIEIEETGRSGIYPASGPLPPGDAPVRGQQAWGQGPAGEAGYEDSGTSEIDSAQQLGMRPGGVVPGGDDVAGTARARGEKGHGGSGVPSDTPSPDARRESTDEAAGT